MGGGLKSGGPSPECRVRSPESRVPSEEKLHFSQKPQEQHPAPSTQPSVAHLLSEAVAELTACKVLNPRLDAEVLLTHTLGTQRAGLYASLHDPLAREQAQ